MGWLSAGVMQVRQYICDYECSIQYMGFFALDSISIYFHQIFYCHS